MIFSQEDFLDFLVHPQETRYIECKSSSPFRSLRNHIVRAALAFANIAGGGTIIVGIEDNGGVLTPVGMADDHISSYSIDDVKGAISGFLSHGREVFLDIFSDDNKRFIVINIEGAKRYPCFAKKGDASDDANPQIHKNAVYFRPRYDKPQTRIATESDWDDLFDDILSFRVEDARKTIRLIHDEDEGKAQRKFLQDLLASESELKDYILSGPHIVWNAFVIGEDYIPIQTMDDYDSFLRSTQIQLRGWPVPPPLYDYNFEIEADYFEYFSKSRPMFEITRIADTGQICILAAFRERWEDYRNTIVSNTAFINEKAENVFDILNGAKLADEFAQFARKYFLAAKQNPVTVEIQFRAIRGTWIGTSKFDMNLNAKQTAKNQIEHSVVITSLEQFDTEKVAGELFGKILFTFGKQELLEKNPQLLRNFRNMRD